MNGTKTDTSGNAELMELNQHNNLKRLTPNEEYRKGIRRRRGRALLFVLLLLIEAQFGLLLLGSVIGENLHNRIMQQIEYTNDGQILFETGTYVGETDFGYLVGEGTFNFASGTVYTGQWRNNMMNGQGILKVPSEGTYTGDFLDSEKSGHGKFVWDDGAVYDGEWKYDQMNGQGTYTSPDGVRYIGTFKDNLFLEGTCEFENDTGSYTATYKECTISNLSVLFVDGTKYSGATDGVTFCGTGEIQFANGDQYVGKFDGGLRNGQGVYTWSNGDSYNGAWEDDSMSGSGKYTYANGSYAQGDFEDNQFIDGSYKVVNDFGDYTFTIENQKPVSIKMVLKSGTTYSGDLKDGELTGTAQISYSNGDKYSGKVVEGYKSGQGSYTWSSGASYEGNWKDDKMSGQGTYYYSSKETGYKLTGNFEKGVPNGECRYYVTSSESYKTDWKNGKCVKVYE